MTYEQWEAKLKELLSDVSEKEKSEAIGYYKEIYSDKKDAGFSDEDIISEFGAPEDCAGKIKAEDVNDTEDISPVNDDAEKNSSAASQAENPEKPSFRPPIATSVAGMILLTIFISIPLFAVLISGIAGLAAICIGGAGVAVGGFGTIVFSVVQLAMGSGFPAFLAMLGMGVAMIGAGIVLAISFFFITKYTAVFTFKLFKLVYINKGGKIK